MTPNKYVSGIDVDTDALAGALRRLADGVEAGDVAITSASTSNDVNEPTDPAEQSLALSYYVTHRYADVVDTIQFATDGYLRFKDRYVRPILHGDKTTTVRHGLERTFDPGETVVLIDEDGGTFATTTVEAYIDMPVRRVCDFGIAGHEADDVADLVTTLRDLYDDDTIDANSYVSVILFGDVDADDDYIRENWPMSVDEFADALDDDGDGGSGE